ncbi:MAG TPA: protein-L-isoaspartate O-methyltransferase [Stellaceae bacterium]|nr:protein-L-isoaspartate O-methyltransferase [Stellaceae bacterium]
MPITSEYLQARANMVDSQLRPNRVLDPALLDAFQTVPREWFVPAKLQAAAYADEDLPLGGGRHVLAPLTIARMLQAARIAKSDVALVVGGGTGYGAALAGKLTRTVTLLEPEAGLAGQARTALRRVGLGNVSVIEGPAAQGYAARSPYDVIIIEGAVAEVPPALLAQLSQGGRLVAILQEVGETPLVAPDIAAIGQAVVMQRIGSGIETEILFETGTPGLPGLGAQPVFSL